MANTSQPLSEVAIANMGGNLLEERALTSLDDNTSYARFVASEFGFLRDELQRAHPWHFNKELAILTPLTAEPAFQWKYKYNLPTDYLRLEPLRTQYPNGTKITYQLMSRKIYTDQGPTLNLLYHKRITNPALFDPLFARVLGCTLAVMACHRVTGKANYYDKCQDALRTAMFNAEHTNALEKGSDDYVDLGYYGSNTAPMFDVMSSRGRPMGC